MMFIGYSQDRKGYRLIDPETYKVISARDVHFLESQMYHSTSFFTDSAISGSTASSLEGGELIDNTQNDNLDTSYLISVVSPDPPPLSGPYRVESSQ
ncbi:hypothetical protein JTE90_000009 [Oedothorax gibbosus]|uniref:Retroviral polymerase SH3-like domain-containing protein n=1 Tax=Oedothorax gibbosus TaxID=931172 RepID=A0AAV6TXI7_9ARAC|nr:hypothetical protein JTE90_000009 [Oedothorax gibbosus]